MGILEDLGIYPKAIKPALKAITGIDLNFKTPVKVKPPSVSSQGTVEEVFKKYGKPSPYGLRNNTSGESSTEEIFRRLAELQDPSRFMDMSSLDAEAAASASAQYDPLIAALQQQMSNAQSTANTQHQQLGDMYGALSRSYEADLPEIAANYDAAGQGTEQAYNDLQAKINAQYQDSQASQQELMQKLNIQAAAPDIVAEQTRDKDYFVNLASKENQTAQTAMDMEQRGAENFTRQGANIAQYEGTGRQANLMEQLRQLLAAGQAEIGQYQAAKQAAIRSNKSTLSRDAIKSAREQAQQEFDNYVTSIKLGKDLNSGNGEANPVKSPADIPGRALSMGLAPESAQRIQSVVMGALGSDEIIREGINPTYGTSLTKEALASRLYEAGRAQGLSSQELQALQLIALEYFGRG